jgi:hypothetical protein
MKSGAPKLTRVQKRVLELLVRGQKAIPGAGKFVYLDGGSICETKTMMALKRTGAVLFLGAYNGWATTPAGRAIVEKP